MIISIWRYSHLALAVSSSLFILIATLTGIVLAIEPIENKISNGDSAFVRTMTIDETIRNIKNKHAEVLSIEIDENNNTVAGYINEEQNLEYVFIDPTTGEKLGNPTARSEIYNFATALHRSLFLKKIGRFFVGLTSFFLFLLSISGIILVLKRQGGIRKIFSKVTDQSLSIYLHVTLGRLALFPLIIITITGVYLSLEKFDLIPDIKNYSTYNENSQVKNIENKNQLTFFETTTLDRVKSIEFPFSEDVEDGYIITLVDKEVVVNQYTGSIVSVVSFPFTKIISYYTLLLHTGKGSVFWSLVLFLTCLAILYFIYSGFKISVNRRNKSKTILNVYTKNEAKYVILVGSENGTTYSYAKEFYKALLNENLKVFIDQLNNYSTYNAAENLIVFTATYGEGDAPTNANNFHKLLKKTNQPNILDYSVVGFGSKKYPAFCKYAIDTDTILKELNGFNNNTILHKINMHSYESFMQWLKVWCANNNMNIHVKQPIEIDKNKIIDLKIIDRTELNCDATFLMKLHSEKKIIFKSGDLLAITPKSDETKRYYSISKYQNQILLSIKKHNYGLVSNIFYNLNLNSNVSAELIEKPEFHFPSKSKEVIFIGNGTGVAPFIGMLDEIRNKQTVSMFLGLRTKESYNMYKPYFENSKLKNLKIAYSQKKHGEYVQNLLFSEKDILIKCIENSGTIMICGSIKMQKEVLQLIDVLSLEYNILDSDQLINTNRLKMDCY